MDSQRLAKGRSTFTVAAHFIQHHLHSDIESEPTQIHCVHCSQGVHSHAYSQHPAHDLKGVQGEVVKHTREQQELRVVEDQVEHWRHSVQQCAVHYQG